MLTLPSKPRLLDLFSGAGGAAKGYQRAGFYVVGVDNRPQPRYCGEEFVLGDALEYVATHGREFDAIHASPPCQGYSYGTNYNHRARGRAEYPLLIGPTRHALYELENVIGARAAMGFTMTLCGTQFGLRVQRHRLFESSHLLMRPTSPCNHRPWDISVRRKRSEYLFVYDDVITTHGFAVRRPPSCRVAEAKQAMECGWMTSEEVGEAIPPQYTAFLGRQLLVALRTAKDGQCA